MPDPDLKNIEALRWGRLLQPAIVAEAAEQQKIRILDPIRDREMIEREIQATGATEILGWLDGKEPVVRSVAHPWMGATLDAVGIDDRGLALLEVKNAGQYHSREWDTDNGHAPAKFVCQVGHQLAVAPAFTIALLSGLVGGNSLRVLRRVRAEMLGTIEAIITLEAQVWRCVLTGEMPAFDGSESHIRALRALHPRENGQSIVLPESLLALHEELQALKPEAAKTEKRIKEIRREIEAALGGNTIGILRAAGQYTNHWQDRAEYVAKAVSFPVLRFEKAK